MEEPPQQDSLSMPLAPEALREDEFELQLRRFELHPAHHVPTYQFEMVQRETHEVLGNIRLSLGNSDHLLRYAGHIGYGVLPEHRGHHYAARSVRLLIPFARKLCIDPLWITCDPNNLASQRTLQIAGAKFVETVDVPADCIIHQKGHPLKRRYRIATRL